MNTEQFEQAATRFLELEKIALEEGEFQPKTGFKSHLDVVAIASAKVSSLGTRIHSLCLNGHKLIDDEIYELGMHFLDRGGLNRKKKKYVPRTYESLACICLAAKELFDNGY